MEIYKVSLNNQLTLKGWMYVQTNIINTFLGGL